jgi:hypothetical protein
MLVVIGLGVVFATGCTETQADADAEADAEAEAAPASDGKADGIAQLAGVYATSTQTLRAGDIPNLELVGGAYVRNRCYHTGCSLRVAETDRFDSFTGSTGKTYVRFWSFEIVWNETSGDRDEVPVVLDTYEIKKTSTGIRLRKTYTSRWLSLRRRPSEATPCSASGGSRDGPSCTCPGPIEWPGAIFVPGLGGCTLAPAATEDQCLESGGFYTDDDATRTGAFCRCGAERYIDERGDCTTIF